MLSTIPLFLLHTCGTASNGALRATNLRTLQGEPCTRSEINTAISKGPTAWPSADCLSRTLASGESCDVVCKPGYTMEGTPATIKCVDGTGEIDEFPTCTAAAGEPCTADADCVTKSCSDFKEKGEICVVSCMGARFATCGDCDLDWCSKPMSGDHCHISVASGRPQCVQKAGPSPAGPPVGPPAGPPPPPVTAPTRASSCECKAGKQCKRSVRKPLRFCLVDGNSPCKDVKSTKTGQKIAYDACSGPTTTAVTTTAAPTTTAGPTGCECKAGKQCKRSVRKPLRFCLVDGNSPCKDVKSTKTGQKIAYDACSGPCTRNSNATWNKCRGVACNSSAECGTLYTCRNSKMFKGGKHCC